MNRAARRRHRALWLALVGLLLAEGAGAWHARAMRRAAASRATHAPVSLGSAPP